MCYLKWNGGNSMWWKKAHINRRDWIIDHFHELDISHEEMAILLMIDLLNQQQEIINPQKLSQKLKLSEKKCDSLLHTLMSKKMVEIQTNNHEITLSIDGIFALSSPYDHLNHDLLNAFEKEFGRPLSANEMMTLNNLKKNYNEKLIIYGLREAIINQKLSMNYIERIVKSNQ